MTTSNDLPTVFQATRLEALDIEKVRGTIREYSLACIRGLVSPDEVINCKLRLRNSFNRNHDRPSIGESAKDIQSNFQKLLIGGHSHNGQYLTRFFRTFYNPMWADDTYGLHRAFEVMIRIRNLMCNLPQGFALDKIEPNGLWSATRIHQYPTGGGYFEKHRDYVLDEVNRDHQLSFYQVILNMSSYGQDFTQGGGYVFSKGKKVLFERDFKTGDILIYDEKTIHGVDEIDPHKVLCLDKVCGRLTAFVSLYKDLS